MSFSHWLIDAKPFPIGPMLGKTSVVGGQLAEGSMGSATDFPKFHHGPVDVFTLLFLMFSRILISQVTGC